MTPFRNVTPLLPVVLLAVLATGCSTGGVGGGGANDSTGSAGTDPVLPIASLPAHAPHLEGTALTGTVRDVTGRTVKGATVYASVNLSGSERSERAGKALLTLGFGCLDQQGCTAPHDQAQSAADGTFAIRVPVGGDIRDSVSLSVVLARPGGRVTTTLTLPAAARRGRVVGPIPLPAGLAHVAHRGEAEVVLPPTLPAARLGRVAATLSRIEVEDGQDTLQTPSEDVSGGYDPRILEDGRVLLETDQTGTLHGLPVEVSSSVTRKGTLVPASRHAACHLIGSRGQILLQHPCQLTDGVLDTAWHPQDDPRCADGPCPGAQQHDHRDTYVTFSHPLAGRLLVLRGCGFTCHVFVLTAHGSYPLPDPPDGTSPDALFLRPLDGRPLTAIHLVTATGGFVDSLREVSVFT